MYASLPEALQPQRTCSNSSGMEADDPRVRVTAYACTSGMRQPGRVEAAQPAAWRCGMPRTREFCWGRLAAMQAHESMSKCVACDKHVAMVGLAGRAESVCGTGARRRRRRSPSDPCEAGSPADEKRG